MNMRARRPSIKESKRLLEKINFPNKKTSEKTSTTLFTEEDTGSSLDFEEGIIKKNILNEYTFIPSVPKRRSLTPIGVSSRLKNKAPCNCPNVLIVDDNAFNLMVAKRLLEQINFTSITVIYFCKLGN